MLWVTVSQLHSCWGNVTGGGGLLDFDVVLFHTGRCHRVPLEGLSHPLCQKILLTCYILECWWECSIIFCFQVNRRHLQHPAITNQSLKVTLTGANETFRNFIGLFKFKLATRKKKRGAQMAYIYRHTDRCHWHRAYCKFPRGQIRCRS